MTFVCVFVGLAALSAFIGYREAKRNRIEVTIAMAGACLMSLLLAFGSLLDAVGWRWYP